MSSIAHDFGFLNFETILNHPKNAELKKNRANPQVLFPGDEVFIPDKNSNMWERAEPLRFTRDRTTDELCDGRGFPIAASALVMQNRESRLRSCVGRGPRRAVAVVRNDSLFARHGVH